MLYLAKSPAPFSDVARPERTSSFERLCCLIGPLCTSLRSLVFRHQRPALRINGQYATVCGILRVPAVLASAPGTAFYLEGTRDRPGPINWTFCSHTGVKGRMQSAQHLQHGPEPSNVRPSNTNEDPANSPKSLPGAVRRAVSPTREWPEPASSSNQGRGGDCSNGMGTGRERLLRGRPRLDTMDRTASDRRRTQIRLAQRAYRNRKDAALSSLEERVAKLEAANTKIRKQLCGLYELLRVEGVLDTRPYVAHRLRVLANDLLSVSATSDDSKTGTAPQPCFPQGQNRQRSPGCEANRATIEDSLGGWPSHITLRAEPFLQADDACASPVIQWNALQSSVHHEHAAQPTSVNIYFPFHVPSGTASSMHVAGAEFYPDAYLS